MSKIFGWNNQYFYVIGACFATGFLLIGLGLMIVVLIYGFNFIRDNKGVIPEHLKPRTNNLFPLPTGPLKKHQIEVRSVDQMDRNTDYLFPLPRGPFVEDHTEGIKFEILNDHAIITAFYENEKDNSEDEQKNEKPFRSRNIFNVIAAVDEKMCVAKNNLLPWDLPSEFQFFLSMTSRPRPGLRNAVIIGHQTWLSMDAYIKRPFPNSLNIVLTRYKVPEVADYPNTIEAHSLQEALDKLKNEEHLDEIWVLGGAEVFSYALKSPNFHRLYLTYIFAKYECDTYFPFLRQELEYGKDFRRIPQKEQDDPRVPVGVQTDPKNGIQYEVVVYGKREG